MSTALYRRYRPETFADVIGQEHVTEPLMTALRKNRVNHAYLFSGPRGCGKTTSARILARCLNCAQGPTDTPCGVCDSCRELARDGAGSLDVIEIDAASHGGVDDARDLRERATFAPVRDRYKVFIIDEAHMVTSAGFNALLKIVEEPPEHILFIFATTEPDKVIGTIRSRTHHYPFRLVPPEPLLAYLERLCAEENVPVAPGVLSLVIRAGGGSVRDTLSVLDQLMAGAADEGLSYEMAIDLLGYTHASLLDDVVDSLSAGDAATVFGAVDRVIQTGHDPRRFVEDLLERFRDLIIVGAMDESARHVLRAVPEDAIARMQHQARQLSRAELSRAADITNAALTEMTGATSPRLHLELLCARLLLPGAEVGERGVAARVDRIERRLNYAAPDAGRGPASAISGAAEHGSDHVGLTPGAGAPAATATDGAPSAGSADEASAPDPARGTHHVVDKPANRAVGSGFDSASGPTAAGRTEGRDRAGTPGAPEAPATSPARPAPARPAPACPAPAPVDEAGAEQPVVDDHDVPTDHDASPVAAEPVAADDLPEPPASRRPGGNAAAEDDETRREEQAAPAAAAAAGSAETGADAPAPGGTSGADVDMVRRAWPEVLEALSRTKKVAWILVSQNGTVRALRDNTLYLEFPTSGIADQFGRHEEHVRDALGSVLGLQVRVAAVHPGSAPPSGGARNDETADGGGRPKAPAESTGRGARPAASGRPVAGDPTGSTRPVTADPAARTVERASRPDMVPADRDTRAGRTEKADTNPRERVWSPSGPVPAASAASPQPPASSAQAGSTPTAGSVHAGAAAPVPARPDPGHDEPPLPDEPGPEEPPFPDDGFPGPGRGTSALRPPAPAPTEPVPGTSRTARPAPTNGRVSSAEAPARPAPSTSSAEAPAGTVPGTSSAEAPARTLPGTSSEAPVRPSPSSLSDRTRSDPTGGDADRIEPDRSTSASSPGTAAPAERPAAAGSVAVPTPLEDIPSEDDQVLEDSGRAGRAAAERVLGAQLVDERELLRD
ncbi:DNA polymerase III subunit gamma and tau [Tersicoccus phoenicis]|uniref:DNA polymerase III subunit gamma and tau n=1 Tax=Tersicoccus phoenicis TaxID=554083 RepID=UPI000A03BE6F|nr:DNA polymerase III subunit gamma and tau [Tersicoccus phoenicis]